MREWPGQIAICVNQIYWTAEVHEAIKAGPQGVKEYHEKLQSQVIYSVNLEIHNGSFNLYMALSNVHFVLKMVVFVHGTLERTFCAIYGSFVHGTLKRTFCAENGS